MIRSAAFFILSLALHATALVYPVSFRGGAQVETIQVRMLPMEHETGGAGAQDGSGNPARRNDRKLNPGAPPAIEPAESKTSSNPMSQALPTEAVTTSTDSSVSLVSAIANPPETDGTAPSGSIANESDSYSAGAFGLGNGASGGESAGLGLGRENGPGSLAGVSTAITQPRYLDTPRPGYPEIARRQGREGRVLLRVLVDDQGRTKAVEINSSSGNEALDRAAAEAVRRWHFHPARYGDKTVESWLRIPIEFRLADAKSW
jgi:periplasmic protein TonB